MKLFRTDHRLIYTLLCAALIAVLGAACVLLIQNVAPPMNWILAALLLIVTFVILGRRIHYIQQHLETTTETVDQQAEIIESHHADERNNLLAGLLLEETLNNTGYRDALEQAEFKLDKAYYAVAILSIPEEQLEDTGMGRPLLSFCAELEEAAQKLLAPSSVYAVVNDGMLVLLISTDDPSSLPDQFQRLISSIQMQKGLPLSIALGHEVYSLHEYPWAYRSALIAYDRMLSEDKPQTLYLDKLTLSDNSSVAFFNELHLMLGYLINNEFVAAVQVCSRVFDVFVVERKSYKTVINDRMAMFRNSFLQGIEAAITNDAVAIEGYLECRKQMEVRRPLEETHAIFLNIAQIAEQSVARRRTVQIGPALRIQSFIDQNYTNPMLDISMISEHLNLSTSYISRMFKNAFDQTVLGYITNKRIDRAKDLLRDTNASIEDIAARVGYNSSTTFSRAFQKLCAVSPNQFRKGGER